MSAAHSFGDLREEVQELQSHMETVKQEIKSIDARMSSVESVHRDIAEVKAVLKGDDFGNEGIVTKVNWMWHRLLALNAIVAAGVAALEMWHALKR